MHHPPSPPTPATMPKPSTPAAPLIVPKPEPIDVTDFHTSIDEMVATGEITKEYGDELLSDPREYEKLLADVLDSNRGLPPQKRKRGRPRKEVSDAGPSRSPEMALEPVAPRSGRSNEVVRVTADHPYESRIFTRGIRVAYGSLRLRCSMEIDRGRQVDERSGERNRSDLRAYSKMRAAGRCLLPGVRVVGDIPGVHVGDVFLYRAEIMLLAVHGAPQAGIDYLPRSSSADPLAISVIASGGYEDDLALEDVLYYTGSGGRTKRNDKHHTEDQKLERGNLGLVSCIRNNTEVRVVRGFKSDTSPSKTVYVYDGLFRVTAYEHVRGESGCMVYRYKMERVPGQPEMGSKSILSAFRTKERLASGEDVEGYLTTDLSGGQEAMPVAVFNDQDTDRYPLQFEYIASTNFPRPRVKKGCSCISECSDDCSCIRKNPNGCAYTDDGYLVQGLPVVYECGESCSCSSTCCNRLSQKGLRFKLEVFRSLQTHWGVRSLDVIPAGSFICEVAGDFLRKDHRAVGMGSLSLFDPASFPQRWREWGDGTHEPFEFPFFPQPDYLVDVSSRRSLGCYICNSELPNVFMQYVLRSGEDKKFPHMMIFSLENIAPLKELGIQYDTSLSY